MYYTGMPEVQHSWRQLRQTYREIIPRQEDTIWCGDFNADNPIWDPYVEEDSRGTKLEEWMCDEGLITLNDGTSTRHSRKRGKQDVVYQTSQ